MTLVFVKLLGLLTLWTTIVRYARRTKKTTTTANMSYASRTLPFRETQEFNSTIAELCGSPVDRNDHM